MASIQHRIAQDTALKMKLERQLENKMRSIFRHMAEESRVHYINTQQVLDVRHYDPEIAITLKQHYRKVASAFTGQLVEDMQKCFYRVETKATPEKIKGKISDFINKRALEQTYFISQSNMKDMFDAYGSAYYSIAFEGVDPKLVAEDGSSAFETRALGRATTIGMTETQYAAEKTKDVEAQVILDNGVMVDGDELRPEEITKVWNALLDDKTRPAHVDADYQIVQQDEPFIVMNQKLMFPGDTSMGASLDNIINCRCNTVRAIELSGLPDFVPRPIYDF